MYETDKETLGYVPDYRRIAETVGPAGRVCEIGVQYGLSLKMWKDLFPDGIVAGVDWNPNAVWPDGTVKIVSNQVDPELPAMLDEHAPAWDLIVDDASHQGHTTETTFNMLWPRIAPGGFYAIEDWFFGLPLWPSTGSWPGAPRFSTNVSETYDPYFLQFVQGLLTRLDEPYPGAPETRSLPRGTDVESVSCRYGLVIVRKHLSEER
jgi:hypothetical protein